MFSSHFTRQRHTSFVISRRGGDFLDLSCSCISNLTACKPPNRVVILSEALRRSNRKEGFVARSRRTPAVLNLPVPPGAFQPPRRHDFFPAAENQELAGILRILLSGPVVEKLRAAWIKSRPYSKTHHRSFAYGMYLGTRPPHTPCNQ